MTTSPGYSGLHRLVLLVDDHDVDGEERLSDRAGLRRSIDVVEARNRRGFRQAVAFDNPDAEGLLELFHQLDRHGRAAGNHKPQCRRCARHVDALLTRVLQQRPVHRRNTDPVGHALARHRSEQRGRIEPRQQNQRAAKVEVREHLRGLSGRMKQRQRDGGHVATARIRRSGAQLGRDHSVHHHVQVRELRAFRLPCRSGRIKDDGRVVG